MELIEYADREMLMIDLAQSLAGELETCLLNHDHASFAVPGGTTPGPMFDSLSAARLDWSRVHVLPTDERMVPPDHPRSNERLIRKRLLTGPAAAARFVPIVPAEGETLADVEPRVAAELPLSLLVLGMGADMHIASLFPDAPELGEALSTDAALVAVHPKGQPEPRISLSGRVLRGALSIHILIAGEEKRRALADAEGRAPKEAPVALVLDEATVHWAP